MNQSPETQKKEKEVTAKPIRCCSSFDDGCTWERVTPNTCFLGIGKNNINIGIADGYCPLLHNPN